MATNPPVTVGPFDNVPAPGSGVKSDWALEISTYVAPTPWVAPTLQNAWVQQALAGYQVCQYRMIGDRVFFRGSIKSGVSGTVAFTLPVGFRPPAGLYLPCMIGGAAAGGYIVLAINGNVSPTVPSSAQVELGMISFSVTP